MIGIVLQARTGSTRLSDKIRLPFFNEECMLDIVIKTCKRALPKLPIILATSTNKNDSYLKYFAEKHQTYFFQGEEANVLKRFISAADKYQLDGVIRVCSDNPFLVENSIREIYNTALSYKDYDYISYQNNYNTPAIKTHLGLYTEYVSLNALKSIPQNNSMFYEHVTNYLYENPNGYAIFFLKMHHLVANAINLRFTCDTPEDFKLLSHLYKEYIINFQTFNITIDNLLALVSSQNEINEKMKENILKNLK